MSAGGVASESCFMSAPAENASSSPVRMFTRTRSSLSAASRAWTSSVRSSKFNAFRTLGRLSRTMFSGGPVSTAMWANCNFVYASSRLQFWKLGLWSVLRLFSRFSSHKSKASSREANCGVIPILLPQKRGEASAARRCICSTLPCCLLSAKGFRRSPDSPSL